MLPELGWNLPESLLNEQTGVFNIRIKLLSWDDDVMHEHSKINMTEVEMETFHKWMMPSGMSSLHPPPIQMCWESMKNGEISFSSKPLRRRAGSHEAAVPSVSLLCSQTPQPAATPASTDAAIIFTLSTGCYSARKWVTHKVEERWWIWVTAAGSGTKLSLTVALTVTHLCSRCLKLLKQFQTLRIMKQQIPKMSCRGHFFKNSEHSLSYFGHLASNLSRFLS